MSALQPLFADEVDAPVVEQPPKEQRPETGYASPEAALGKTNVVLVSPAAEGVASLLRELAIADRTINALSTPRAAARLIESRQARPGAAFLPSVFVAFEPTHEVERLAKNGPSVGVTVVLAVASLQEVRYWDRRAWTVFRPKVWEVAA